MLRKAVARSRFQVDDVSSAGPRPKYRKLIFVSRLAFCIDEGVEPVAVVPEASAGVQKFRGRIATRPAVIAVGAQLVRFARSGGRAAQQMGAAVGSVRTASS